MNTIRLPGDGEMRLTRREAAAYCRVPYHLLESLARNDKGPRRLIVSARRTLYCRDDLDFWMQAVTR